jgi:acetyl-CoA carboxylase alpha subunit
VIKAALADLGKLSPEAVRKARREKFLAIGRNL